MTPKNALIIGAGIGGLSSAIRLRCAGFNVTMLEKNPIVGGKMYQFEDAGYRWDTGPSVITMRHVFEDLFTLAGRNLEDYLTFLPIDPLTRYFYTDGTIFNAYSDLPRMSQAITAIDERDVEGYLAYLSYAARIHRITGRVFIYDNPPTPASFAKVPVHEWLGADPFRTMDSAIRSFVKSPHLRQLLGRFATYVGGSPYQAPATLNVIAHVELNGGVWYPKGGVYSIAQALEKLALELGVIIHTNTPTAKITLENGHVTGVITQDGTFYPADVVVSNVDVATTYNHLLPKDAIRPNTLNRVTHYEPSCSGFIMLLGVKKPYPTLAHHNIFFSNDYQAEFNAIFKQLIPSDNPTVYVSITSKSDPSHAPEGTENWFVMVNAPALTPDYNWEAQKHAYRDLVLEKMASFGIDIRSHIACERILTPSDLETMSGAWRGALYGPSANKKFTAFLRPHNRSKEVKGLYFAGGTTHPGGGVPMVMLSGKVASDLILQDMR